VERLTLLESREMSASRASLSILDDDTASTGINCQLQQQQQLADDDDDDDTQCRINSRYVCHTYSSLLYLLHDTQLDYCITTLYTSPSVCTDSHQHSDSGTLTKISL